MLSSSVMGNKLSAYIDDSEKDGKLDEDEAAVERMIASRAEALRDGLDRAKEAAKKLKSAQKARDKAAAQHAPADALPPPAKVVVPDEAVEHYDQLEADVVPLIKQYLRRACAAAPKLDYFE